ncbi:MAG: PilZ domain-containing protein [Desulfobacterales bacterium]|nr:PilZ domain-containing protein [Desulfobacterales bacterium]
MASKIFVNIENMAVFKCPECGLTRTEDMTTHQSLGKTIETKCTCKCGHIFFVTVIMEKRKYYRKETSLPGQFSTLNRQTSGLMTVKNVSLSGLRFKLNENKKLKVGDKLNVEFTLDDKERSVIQKEAEIKLITDLNIDAEFSNVELYGRLGPYLFS